MTTTRTRTNTPDVVTVDADGRKRTTITMKRACNGCGQHLGDATDKECPACAPTAPEPRCLPLGTVDGDEACLDGECDHSIEPGADYCTNTSRHTICGTHSEINNDGAITHAEPWPCKHSSQPATA